MTDLRGRLQPALADRYAIERELGQGGMATVYLAQDLKHDRKVAIKVLKPELSASVDADRFLSEIRTTARLQHPNILPLFDSGMVAGFEGRDADPSAPATPSTPSTPATPEAWAMPGDTELAFTLLEEAVHGGFYPGEFIAKHCPFFANLRGTPRFEAIAETALRRAAEFDAAVAAG